jgi:N-acetylneuraminic acid mutarotase
VRRTAALVLSLLAAGCGGGDSEPREPRWEDASPLLHARSAHAVVSDGETVYALGGTDAEGRPVLAVERFDGDEWAEETTLPGEGLNATAAALVDGRLYVIGGFETTTNVATDRVRVYDTQTKEWGEAAALPAPRGGHAAAVLDGRIHVLGGGDSASTLTHHSVYDPAADAWSEEAPLPVPKGSVAAVVHEGELWAIGGRSGLDDFGEVDVWDPETGEWSIGPALPPRGAHGAAVFDGAIHVFGGESQAEGRVLDDVLRLEGEEWTQVAPLPAPRSFARAVPLGEDVLVVGGSTSAGASHAPQGSDRVDRLTRR